MKSFFTGILCFAMALGLCGCSCTTYYAYCDHGHSPSTGPDHKSCGGAHSDASMHDAEKDAEDHDWQYHNGVKTAEVREK